MKKHICIILLLSAALLQAQDKPWMGKSVDFTHGGLIVSPNQRFLIHADGTPFFYLGDTAWELFHRLNEEETDRYLENRRAKGFTVIQAVILAELDGLNTPNRNGDKPLLDNDPEKPNEAYFQWVDKVIRKAGEKGIYIGLLPTWGDKVDPQWGVGPAIFTSEKATAYGKYLGRRYKDFPNIIWINGGDRLGGGDNYAVWDALGKAIKAEDPNHLMTFHPMGEQSSARWFHDCDWLDFNMCQTGHGQRSYDIYRQLVVADYNRKPIKPCMDGEPRYEDHPVSWMPETYGWFDHVDVRQSMYWNLFSGAFGHTYGCHPIWQFKSDKDEPVGLARHNWDEVLDLEGAFDLIHARRLLESFDFTSRIPDQSIIITPQNFATDVAIATRGKDYAFVYLPNGHQTEVALDKISGAGRLSLQWYNPRNGEYTDILTVNATGTYQAGPPTSGRGNDWILVMKVL
ncbi:MAG: glycoside hydrolase family 140 protein [Tannerella sp.]|jgi:hypothetical protein|nr:glycoside hydrolase family 140 protein [Tannerella sp.]